MFNVTSNNRLIYLVESIDPKKDSSIANFISMNWLDANSPRSVACERFLSENNGGRMQILSFRRGFGLSFGRLASGCFNKLRIASVIWCHVFNAES